MVKYCFILTLFMQTANRLHGGDSFTVHLLIREHQTKSVEGKDEVLQVIFIHFTTLDAKDTESKSRCKCCIIL